MQHSLTSWSRLAFTSAIAAWLLAACDGSPVGHQPAPGPSPTEAIAAGSARPYQLYTHCGIYEARIGVHYYVAVRPLSDGSGNPPPGWGNPYQPGTMAVLSRTTAVFRDSAGHQVQFRLRPGATTFLRLCD